MQICDLEFIEKLLSKMTLKEKIGQLNQPETPLSNNLEEFKESIRRGEVGSILMSVGATAGNDEQGAIDVLFYNELQRIAIEESRCGIPILFGRDVIHGHKTVFPIPLAMAASFNPELIEKCYSDIADEASNESVHWTFTPMLDMSRDPRWGRIIEGPGEDPYVGSCFAKAVVKGVQGDNPSNKNKMLACAKHYIGYGASEGGRDYHRAEISDYSLYNYYLPAFKSAIDAGVATIMSSFNDINGQPVTSSKKYLDKILRKELGFEGFVVSDYDSVEQLVRQGVANDEASSATLSINAGVDMDMHDNCYIKHLEELVRCGKVSEEVIDNSVRRILEAKLKKGLFENPYCDVKTYDRQKHLADAKEMAVESIVLLKNDNSLLPLDVNTNVAIIGPFAHEQRSLLGSWTIDGKAEETESFVYAMKQVAKGNLQITSGIGFNWDNSSQMMMDSDIVVLALGESWAVTGEARSNSEISIPDEQIRIIEKAKASGKKVVGVFFCGRPIAMQGIADNLDAVVYAWHCGSKTAAAVTDILYGNEIPSGKLPITIPRKATHIPLYYNVTSSGKKVNCYYGENPGNCYVDSIPTPYYPFGYGLSYTSFCYDNVICDNKDMLLSDILSGKSFKISLKIKNVGNYNGKETVQLYIHDPVADSMRPLRELKAFEKIFLKKGQSAIVDFSLGKDELGYYTDDGTFVVEKGEIEVYIGSNCFADKKITINII